LLSLIPVVLGIPYLFFVVYRLFIQGTNPSDEDGGPGEVHLNLSFRGEGKQLAGWAGGLAGLVTFISIIVEFLH
jgi:hypothetical protein